VSTLLIVGLVLCLLALRQSVLVILGAVLATLYLSNTDDSLRFIALDAWQALNKDILLSIPLFILCGQLMSEGSIASRLVALVRALVGPIPGGLAIATILSCATFAAVSGSSTVTLLAVGSVMFPALIEAGYSRKFAIGALCAAGTLGIIVPPSIPLILYGVMTGTSITDLFIAGIGPAIVLTLLLAVYSGVANFSRRQATWSLQEIVTTAKEGAWSLFMPFIILGGIYSGHFTATESAAVAVIYALIIETFVHRELNFQKINDVIYSTSKLLGSLFPVLMLAVCLTVYLTYEKSADAFIPALAAWSDTPTQFVLITNAVLLLVGTLIDIGSAILIFAPLLQPIAAEQGFDPVHFGISMIVNLEIGYLTPPFGLNLIVAMAAFNASFKEVCLAVIPFLAIMLIGLGIVVSLPALSLFLL
jgi:C4-dicarboxylate transporter DctM subunit